MEERVENAVKFYLEHRGYEIVDEVDGFIIAYDDEHDAVVVIKYGWSDDMSVHVNPMSVHEFEQVAVKFLMTADETFNNVNVRHDVVDLHVIASNRAFIRHRVDALNGGDDVDIQ